MSERETLEVDVLIVGAGVAGLSCAIHLVDRVKDHKPQDSGKSLETPERSRSSAIRLEFSM